jgi:ribonuclease P protein component
MAVKSQPRSYNETFPPEKRVQKRKEYLSIQEKGEKFRSRHFLLAMAVDNLNKSPSAQDLKESSVDNLSTRCETSVGIRLGITISKKVDKRAVRRNRLKRRVKEYLRKKLPRIKREGAIVVIALKGSCDLPFDVISKELNYLLKKAELKKAAT